jgi:hypothetical protein
VKRRHINLLDGIGIALIKTDDENVLRARRVGGG